MYTKKITQLTIVFFLLFLFVFFINFAISSFRYNIAGILFNRVFLGQEHKLALNAENLFESVILDHKNEQTLLRLGQLYQLTGDYTKAENIFQNVIDLNPIDDRSYLYLSRVLAKQDRENEAIRLLLDQLLKNPLDEAIQAELELLYGVPSRTQVIAPGQTLSATLSLPASHSRWLKLSYNSQAAGSQLQILIDQDSIARLENKKPGKKSYQFFIPTELDDQVSVKIVNYSKDVRVELEKLQLEYISNVEMYSDITNATWTEYPHKVIGPQSKYETLLYHQSEKSKKIAINFFDFPKRQLDVVVNSEKVGTIIGQGATEIRSGGATTFSFPVSNSISGIYQVTLKNSGELPVGVRFVYINE